jgi:hypothetical protein
MKIRARRAVRRGKVNVVVCFKFDRLGRSLSHLAGLIDEFTTPRMHGIHHSLVPEELCSNWPSGLTLWDRLHGTLRLNVPQNQGKLMEMPLDEQQRYPPWVRPDGTTPHRDEALPRTSTTLVREAATDLSAGSPATRRV